ncbi:MAG: class I SAM-dependent methyltransferase [Fimbriiglobus sp.]|nr:class I SAM-dependent methyltransferase [Fimbriiglobus sp.]
MSDDLFLNLPAAAAPVPTATSYDEVPYLSNPFAQTHPSRLYTIGTLFGLKPAPPQRCRVLELACAAGGNLVPMADYLPDSEFVGIDLSAKQIADGQAVLNQLGLTNVVLKRADIREVDAAYGTFDYIIAHGVYSWVPAAVRDKILDICRTLLTPNGIAYVSYNTYPGWHMRGMIRDMMRYHSSRFATPADRTAQARGLLNFLATSVKQEGPYSQLLQQELEGLRYQSDHYLYHEHLEEVNDPVYFHQFVESAAAKGLKYLGEARVGTMVTGNFGPEIEDTLRKLATDQVMAEQYMDFLRNRMFRETLLCHAERSPSWSVPPETLRGLHVASSARPQLADGQQEFNVADESAVTYRSPTGMNMTTSRPLLKTAMTLLQQAYPATTPFDALRRQARAQLGGNPDDPARADEDTNLLAVGLLNCYMSSDLVELHGMPITFCRTPGERPVALPHARLSAAANSTAANRRHEVIRLSEFDRRLIPLLDGTRDRPALVNELTDVAASGSLTVRRDNVPITDRGEIHAALASIIDEALNKVAGMAVLVG